MRDNSEDLAAMVAGYVECLLWAGLDWTDTVANGGTEANPRPLDENYGPEDLAPDALRAVAADCRGFLAANVADLTDRCQPSGPRFLLDAQWSRRGILGPWPRRDR